MPCTIKMRLVEARDMPVVDRTRKQVDAYMSQPIEFKLMDHDVYTTDATVGIVYVDPNCLLMRDGHVIQGWFPVYDTLLGV
ncbi:unnamed protein product [Peronospora destructor]|uniref:Uncharacterized protein n=1 Tax=Peronospora destructor TaxID=86335 RepID=A0AAV0VCQ4_9STRA|nr:unnamed protein product [Peronospora destructor]